MYFYNITITWMPVNDTNIVHTFKTYTFQASMFCVMHRWQSKIWRKKCDDVSSVKLHTFDILWKLYYSEWVGTYYRIIHLALKLNCIIAILAQVSEEVIKGRILVNWLMDPLKLFFNCLYYHGRVYYGSRKLSKILYR
jgi:hypothetical protein